jgi:RNA polymerase sigma-B factor
MSEQREGERADELELFTRLRATGDPVLRERLIEDHLWLARHLARRFAGRGEPSEDLVQVASFALVNAVDRFDTDQNVRFSTFAMPTILGELRRHFRDRTWSMRVSRRLKDLHLELRSATEHLTHELGRSPTIDELADALDTSPEDVLEALEAGAAYRTASIDQGPPGAEHDEGIVPAEDHEELETTSERVDVNEALQTLSHRDRRVIYLRYHLDLTQSEIAEEVGVSQVHVSRILRSSLATLAEELGVDAPEDPTDGDADG